MVRAVKITDPGFLRPTFLTKNAHALDKCSCIYTVTCRVHGQTNAYVGRAGNCQLCPIGLQVAAQKVAKSKYEPKMPLVRSAIPSIG